MKEFATFKNFILANTVFPIVLSIPFYLGAFSIPVSFWLTIFMAAALLAANIFFFTNISTRRSIIATVGVLNILGFLVVGEPAIITAIPILTSIQLSGAYFKDIRSTILLWKCIF